MNDQAKQFLAAHGIDADKVQAIAVGGGQSYNGRTIRDIAFKLAQYGSISVPSANYLKALIAKIGAPVVPVPVGRVEITGVVAKAEMRDTNFGWVPKMLWYGPNRVMRSGYRCHRSGLSERSKARS